MPLTQLRFGDIAMMKKGPNKPRAILTIVAATAGALLPAKDLSAAPSDDAYLREIQSEGKKLEPLDKAREEIRKSEAREKSGSAKREPMATSVTSFETLLRADAPASFDIYRKLPDEKQQAVFETYRKQSKLSEAKRRIVDLYLGL